MVLYLVNHLRKLVHASPVRGRETAPLVSIDRAEVAVLIGPFVPNGISVVFEIFDVGVTADEPQKLVDNGFEMNFLGCQERKALAQVETHLIAEHALGADSGAVCLDRAVFHYVAEKV